MTNLRQDKQQANRVDDSIEETFGPPADEPQIAVLRLQPTKKDGTVKAFIDVEIPGFGTIVDCKIVQQNGQTAWLGMPAKSWMGTDGKTKYAALVNLVEPLKTRVQAAALAAWRNVR